MFNDCERTSRGRHIWKWIEKIAGLKEEKVRWLPEFDMPDKEKFIISADGVNFPTWEAKHPTRPVSKSHCSHKHNH